MAADSSRMAAYVEALHLRRPAITQDPAAAATYDPGTRGPSGAGGPDHRGDHVKARGSRHLRGGAQDVSDPLIAGDR